MTIIDIDDRPGKFFEMDGGGRVQLRTVPPEAFKAIRKQTVKKKVDFKKIEGTPVRLEHEEVDDDLQNELFWDYVIVSWENLFDAKEKPIPCTKENKALLMNRSPKFVVFISESLKTLNEDEQREAGVITKN